MKIAVFIKSTTFHSGYGGLETQNKVLCEGLAKRGHQITVFSPERGVDPNKISRINDIDFILNHAFLEAKDLAEWYYFTHLAGRTVKIPALKREEVHFTREGWNHLLQEKRSTQQILTRLFALTRMEAVLSDTETIIDHDSRINKDGHKVEYWAFQEIVENALVKVIVSSFDGGPKFVLSTIWKGTKKDRGIAKELSLACNPRRRRMDTSQLLSETTLPETCLNVNDAGVDYIFVPCVYRMMFSSVDRNNWLNKSYQEFIKVHKQEPFDIIISQSSAGLGVTKKKHELGIKVVGISHGTIGGEMKTLLNSAKSPVDLLKSAKSLAFGLTNFFGRQRQYIHGCDAIVAVSSAVKKSIIAETYAPEEKITVIHNGMDGNKVPKKVWKKAEADEPLKILYIGRIEESKGLRELLEACKDLNGVVLNIVGDGPYLEELKALSRRLKMSQKVLFYGKLPFEKAVEMYACNDVFVLPTKRVEGLPMTLVEACFAGLPIIATDMGGNKDAVEDGYNGFLLTKLKVEILKQRIVDLAENRALTEKLGSNGKIKAEKEFELDKMVSAYEQICSFERSPQPRRWRGEDKARRT